MAGFFIALMPLLPMWSKLKAVAHTLTYDGAIVKDHQRGKPLPASHGTGTRHGRWEKSCVDAPREPVASVLPNAQYRTLEGQTHMLKPKVHVSMLVEFFKDSIEEMDFLCYAGRKPNSPNGSNREYSDCSRKTATIGNFSPFLFRPPTQTRAASRVHDYQLWRTSQEARGGELL